VSEDGVPPAAAVARPRWRRLLASRAAWALVASVVVAAVLFGWLDAIGGPEALRERFGWSAAVILLTGQAVSGLWPVPASEVLALANSVLHGFWLGALLNWTGWMLAALLQYTLFRHLARDLDVERSFAMLPGWLTRFPVEHPAFLILGRVVPLPAGPQIVGCAAGALRVPLWRYLWCAAIGIAPGAMFISGVANGLVAL
jgi:uncharacterized membrane protein YdjX (TVP38/TMEM64 family)